MRERFAVPLGQQRPELGECGQVRTLGGCAPRCAHYHVRFRNYSPELGRWLERDPLGYVDGMSLYGYARSNPMAYLDPLGLKSTQTDEERKNNCAWLEKRRCEGLDDESYYGAVKNLGCDGKGGDQLIDVDAAVLSIFVSEVIANATDPHTILDGIGMVPVLGAPADIFNAGLYALEGDYANAMISLAGAVPGAGEVLVSAKYVAAVPFIPATRLLRSSDDTAQHLIETGFQSFRGRSTYEVSGDLDALRGAGWISDAGKPGGASGRFRLQDPAIPGRNIRYHPGENRIDADHFYGLPYWVFSPGTGNGPAYKFPAR